MYKSILEFNKAFGVLAASEPNLDIFTKDKKLLTYRLALIDEEVAELHDAVKEKNIVNVIDALADITYVVLGAFTAIGINADDAFKIVHESNMSKLCPDEATAKLTVANYLHESPQRYDSPCYRLSDDGTNWVVYNKSTMKILKNINYKPADFTLLAYQE